MILTLTLNPAIDLTYTLPALRPGTSHRVENVLVRAGGKGVNVARVLAAQGHPALVVAPVGGATGAQFRAELRDAGLDHRLLEVSGPTRRTVAIVTEAETTNLNEAGHGPRPAEAARLLDLLDDALTAARVLVCSGSLPAGAPPGLLAEVVARGRRAGVPVLVDTSGPPLLAAARAGAHVLKPNRAELLAATGAPEEAGLAGVVAAAHDLAAQGGATVFASLGEEGLLAVGADGPIRRARLPRPLPGNPTGAGDAAVAALAADLAAGSEDLDRTLVTAVAWSAAAVRAPAAGSIADPSPLLGEVLLETLAEPAPAEEET